MLDVVAIWRLVHDRHHLAAGVERRLADTRVRIIEISRREAELCRIGDKGGLCRFADGLALYGIPLGIGAQCHAAHETVLVLGEVADDRHLVLRERAGLVGADDLRAAKRLDCRELADDRIVLAHLRDADREHDRDDGGKALRNGSNGKRDSDHEGIEHESHVAEEAHAVFQPRDDEDEGADHDADDRKDLGELVELLLERRLLVLCLGQSVGNLAHLRVHASCDDDSTSTAIDDGRAHVAHVLAVAERDVLCTCDELELRLDLVRRHGLAGKRCLLDLHRGALDDTAVGRDGVACFEHDNIADDKLGGRNRDDLPVTDDLRLGSAHLLERCKGLFCLRFLHDAEHGIHDDNEADDHDVGKVCLALCNACQCADHGSHDQHDDHGIGHLSEETLPERILLRFLELVQPIPLETLLRLGRREAIGAVGLDVFDNLGRVFQILFQSSLLGSWASSRLMPDNNSPGGARAHQGCHAGRMDKDVPTILPCAPRFMEACRD